MKFPGAKYIKFLYTGLRFLRILSMLLVVVFGLELVLLLVVGTITVSAICEKINTLREL
jgi:hypothetical protein